MHSSPPKNLWPEGCAKHQLDEFYLPLPHSPLYGPLMQRFNDHAPFVRHLHLSMAPLDRDRWQRLLVLLGGSERRGIFPNLLALHLDGVGGEDLQPLLSFAPASLSELKIHIEDVDFDDSSTIQAECAALAMLLEQPFRLRTFVWTHFHYPMCFTAQRMTSHGMCPRVDERFCSNIILIRCRPQVMWWKR